MNTRQTQSVVHRYRVTFLLSCSFLAIFSCFFAGSRSAHAAFGDCVLRLWGGENQETTYAPPYRSGEQPSLSAEQPYDPASASPIVLGQYPNSGSGVCVAPPSYTTLSPPKTTVMQPVVTHQWSYSRIASTQYKPVRVIDPVSGEASTYYRLEESRTLLPWLHRKEIVKYQPREIQEPFPVGLSKPGAGVAVAFDSRGNPVTSDPFAGRILSRPITPSSRENFALSEPITTTTAVTYVTPRVSSAAHDSAAETVPNYGTPRLLDPQWKSAPVSDGDPANDIPVVGSHARRQAQDIARPPSNIGQVAYAPQISKGDFGAIGLFSPEKYETEFVQNAKEDEEGDSKRENAVPRTRTAKKEVETESSGFAARNLPKSHEKGRDEETSLSPPPKTISLSASNTRSGRNAIGTTQLNYRPLKTKER